MISASYKNLEKYTSNLKNIAMEALNKTSGTKETTNASNNAKDTAVMLTLSNQGEQKGLYSTKALSTKNSSTSTTNLKLGSKGEKVVELQKNLTELGFSTKGTDGVFGNNTKKAVIAFQKAYGLTADGIAGAETQKVIANAIESQKKETLKVGSKGSKVTKLQKNLTKLGYDTKGTDGVFGNNTKKAVIAFQKAYGLTADGIAGTKTLVAIEKALYTNKANSLQKAKSKSTNNSQTTQRMLDNIMNDTSLKLSTEKKTAMVMAAERLLGDGYEPEFVAGVLGNIQNEGTPGKFESSNYKSNPSAEPSYLKYMDSHHNYRTKFSGKTIQEVGISAAIELQNYAKKSGYAGKFGLGMIQWTGSRTEGLLESYQKYATSDKPTTEECIKAEVNYLADELKGDHWDVYAAWKSGDKTAKSAGELFCSMYEKPKDIEGEARVRANNASKIYEIMMK